MRTYLRSHPDTLLAPVTILPEVAYLLRERIGAQAELAFAQSVANGEIAVEGLARRDVVRAGELMAEGDVVVCSEYSLTPVTGALFPNRLLRAAGLLRVREIAGKEYLDFELSDAFAMVDHQIAHIFCKPGKTEAARQSLADWEFTCIDHPRAGELVAIAPLGKWFAYYWWQDWAKAPEFAYTVDIHRKPGYDPCELWFDWPRFLRTRRLPTTATKPELVKGSHGRVDDDPSGWATLLLDEKAAAAARLGEHAEAMDLAPLVCRLLLG